MSIYRKKELPEIGRFRRVETVKDVVDYLKQLRQALDEELTERKQDFDWLKIDNKPWVDVREYGAKCDGVTDDTTKVQAANDAFGSNKGVVFLPPKCTWTPASITIASAVTIVDFSNTYYPKIWIGYGDAEFEVIGPDPGAGYECPAVVVTNQALDGKRNPGIVGRRGIGTKARGLWITLFANHGDSKSGVDACDYVLRSAQSAVYNTGTVDMTNDSKAVVGNGTSWTSNFVGAILVVGDADGENIQNYFGIVASVEDGTHLTLESVWGGTTVATQDYALYGGTDFAGQALRIMRIGQNGAFLKSPTGDSNKFYDPRIAAKYGYTAVFGPCYKGLTADANALMVLEAASDTDGEVGFVLYGRTIADNYKIAVDKATDYLNFIDDDYGTFLQFIPNATQSKVDVAVHSSYGLLKIPVISTASLPAAHASMDGAVIIEDGGAGDRNLIIYAGGERFRIDGGTTF